ncbi:hypothetical protein ACIREO_23205 [Streptomyces sp. NPDC102441]|uniref:hypothetical protein n=1 Tax=Streptomyces sp. NPDC102441 TaxID=3366176 RepID=UPI003810214D
MFAKLRRNRRPTSAAGLPAAPSPSLDVPAEVPVADREVLARIERVRAALTKAGAPVRAYAPEPNWFAEVRSGGRLDLGPQRLSEISGHVGGLPAQWMLSEETCVDLLRRIGTNAALQELKDEGMDVRFCGVDLTGVDEASVRALGNYVRKQIAACEEPGGRSKSTCLS